MFDNIRSDMHSQERTWGSLGFWVLVVYRFGRWRCGLKLVLLRKLLSPFYSVAYKLAQIASGMELPCEAQIGHRFIIDHSFGIVISGDAVIGDNCRIRTGAVVGLSRVEAPGSPVIGDNVDIGAGAKILGPITVGDNVLIGANAVVIRDVPANSVAFGVPAQTRPRRNAAEQVLPLSARRTESSTTL